MTAVKEEDRGLAETRRNQQCSGDRPIALERSYPLRIGRLWADHSRALRRFGAPLNGLTLTCSSAVDARPSRVHLGLSVSVLRLSIQTSGHRRTYTAVVAARRCFPQTYWTAQLAVMFKLTDWMAYNVHQHGSDSGAEPAFHVDSSSYLPVRPPVPIRKVDLEDSQALLAARFGDCSGQQRTAGRTHVAPTVMSQTTSINLPTFQFGSDEFEGP